MGSPGQASESQAIDVGAHTPVVRRALRRLGVPPEFLDDAVQDVFTVVVRREGDFERERSLVNWLWGIARGVASTHRRALGRRARLHAALATVGDDARSTEDELARAEASARVAAFVERLPAAMREVFVLAHLQGYSGPEIAARLGINLNTAYARVRTTRLRLEAELLGEAPPSIGARIVRAFAPLFAASSTTVVTVGMTASLVWIGARTPIPAVDTAVVDAAVVAERGEPPVALRPAVRRSHREQADPIATAIATHPADPPRVATPAITAAAPTRPARAVAPVVENGTDVAIQRDAAVVVVADEGLLLRPEGLHVASGAAVEFPSMIATRGDFVPELVRVAADL